MRAVQLVEPGTPLEDREVPVPEIGPGEVLVRVSAAGICGSDAHYRAGYPEVGPLPLTLGHEVAGVVERAAEGVDLGPGDRVCLHYQVSCGRCTYCTAGSEQFCPEGRMLGNGRPGGYADFVVVPAVNAHPLPDEIPFEHGAVMMCSAATSLHALRKGRLRPGERVTVVGVGGLGMSAVQIAFALGASTVYAVDPNPAKRAAAAALGAVPVDATADPVGEITAAGGADVALELVGSAGTMRTALDVLRPMGRAVAVGLTADEIRVGPYRDLVRGEHELIGASDHLGSEIPDLLEMAGNGRLDLTAVVGATVPLDATRINEALDRLETGTDIVRTVIVP